MPPSDPFLEPVLLKEEWLVLNSNAFTFSKLCEIIGINPNLLSLVTDEHRKKIRKTWLLKYHPDKCRSVANPNDYFRFYKDCLDRFDNELEAHQFSKKVPAPAASAPTYRPPPQRPVRPRPTSTASSTANYHEPRFSKEAPSSFHSYYASSSSSGVGGGGVSGGGGGVSGGGGGGDMPNFASDREFRAFLDQKRREEMQRNASAYNYESQEQTNTRFQAKGSGSSGTTPKPRNNDDINAHFDKQYMQRAAQYQKTAAKLAAMNEQRFGHFTADGKEGKEFDNQWFDEAIRSAAAAGGGGGGGGSGGGGFGGGGEPAPKRIQPVCLLSNSCSTRLDYAQTLFPGSDSGGSSVSFMGRGGGSKVGGIHLSDAHDPLKNLISRQQGPERKQYRSFKEYEAMRGENLFQNAPSKEEHEAMLREEERKREARNNQRLYQMYA